MPDEGTPGLRGVAHRQMRHSRGIVASPPGRGRQKSGLPERDGYRRCPADEAPQGESAPAGGGTIVVVAAARRHPWRSWGLLASVSAGRQGEPRGVSRCRGALAARTTCPGHTLPGRFRTGCQTSLAELKITRRSLGEMGRSVTRPSSPSLEAQESLGIPSPFRNRIIVGEGRSRSARGEVQYGLLHRAPSRAGYPPIRWPDAPSLQRRINGPRSKASRVSPLRSSWSGGPREQTRSAKQVPPRLFSFGMSATPWYHAAVPANRGRGRPCRRVLRDSLHLLRNQFVARPRKRRITKRARGSLARRAACPPCYRPGIGQDRRPVWSTPGQRPRARVPLRRWRLAPGQEIPPGRLNLPTLSCG
jgi:hypothetical protein